MILGHSVEYRVSMSGLPILVLLLKMRPTGQGSMPRRLKIGLFHMVIIDEMD